MSNERIDQISESTKAAVRMRNEIYRLTDLVQAQKELIEFLRTFVPFAERRENSNYNHFLNKIKEIESCKEFYSNPK